MRHRRGYRKLGRTSEHRQALLRNLVLSLFRAPSGRIRTTVEKAKEARRFAEKMITLGKRGFHTENAAEAVHCRRLVARDIPNRDVIRRLFTEIAPKYAQRGGGYTRVLRLGPRRGDNAEMAYLELVDIAEEALKAKSQESKAKADTAAKATEKKAADKPADGDAAEKKPAKKPAKERAPRKQATSSTGSANAAKKVAVKKPTARKAGDR